MKKGYFFRGGVLHHIPAATNKVEQQERDQAAPWTRVASSNVKAICWRAAGDSEKERGLGVWFDPKDRHGESTGKQSVYWYPSAPREAFEEMLAAPSKGTYLHQRVIPSYPHAGPFSPPSADV